MAEIGENTQVKANIAFMAKVIAIVGSAVWGYSVIWNKINTIEVNMMRIDHELHLNSEFRIKWPRGELGALPDDAEQNMRLNLQQQRIDKLDSWVDGLRFQRANPE
jgi:hypothetical protein